MTNEIIDGEVIKDINDTNDKQFSVYQFFPDGISECIVRFTDVKTALHTAYHYTHNVSAFAGITQRVIITDGGDCIVFEWTFGEGITFPTNELRTTRDYHKETLQ